MKPTIDLNADLGEGSGHDAELLQLVSSANIATGFHVGDPSTVAATIAAARDNGVAVGAHPSFADRESFGRRESFAAPDEVFGLMVDQLGAFAALARDAGVRVTHVKPHGALYNMAARDPAIAEPLARAVAAVDSSLILFALPQSEMARAAERHALRVAREVFADRNYMPDGSLVPRSRSDALLHDPVEAAARVLRMLRERKVRAIGGEDIDVAAETVCVHGDTPEAVAFARALRAHLADAGIAVAPPRLEPARPRAVRIKTARGRAVSNTREQGEHRHLSHLPSFRDNPIVFITACTQERRKILGDQCCHQVLRTLWERSSISHGWWVGHYILMPDHVHLFARPEIDAKPLANWIGLWKSVSARQIAKELRISPPIWQDDYFDRFLRSGERYEEKWNYVEQNAVRAGLVDLAPDWPHRGEIHELRF